MDWEQLTWWQQTLWIFIGIPITLFLLYIVFRVISWACLQSWWSLKLTHSKKLLDLFKEKGEEKDGKR